MYLMDRDRVERWGKCRRPLLSIEHTSNRVTEILLVSHFSIGACKQCSSGSFCYPIRSHEKCLFKIGNGLSVLFMLTQFVAAPSVHFRFQHGITVLINKSDG